MLREIDRERKEIRTQTTKQRASRASLVGYLGLGSWLLSQLLLTKVCWWVRGTHVSSASGRVARCPVPLLQRHFESLIRAPTGCFLASPNLETSISTTARHNKDRHPHSTLKPHDCWHIALSFQPLRCYEYGIMTVPSCHVHALGRLPTRIAF